MPSTDTKTGFNGTDHPSGDNPYLPKVELTFVDDSGKGPSHKNARIFGGALRFKKKKSSVTNIFPGLNRL
ncbi:MAG: hypothetical protein CSA20_08600 [Deltaproteobacteria bacterium]|nr:MAG: hypothetical protein CSA20_08600 [Deltaproteobacteria bacterium]